MYIKNYLKQVEIYLNEIISDSLWASPSDPSSYNLRAAANAYKTLKLLNLSINGEEDVILTLTEENIDNENYLK